MTYGHAHSLIPVCACGRKLAIIKQEDGNLKCARCAMDEEKTNDC